MERQTLLWTLVAFFGASLAFRLIQSATAGSGTGVTLALELVALAAMIAVIAVVVRRRR